MDDDVFVLPDLGEGLTEAEIVTWHVALGDRVVADQPLVSVETDKAVVEVPSPRGGRITKLFGEPGDTIEVGAPLVAFGTGEPAPDAGAIVGSLPADTTTVRAVAPPAGEPAPAPLAAPVSGAAPGRAAPAVRALAQKLGVDIASLAGSGPDGRVTTADVEHAAEVTQAIPLSGPRKAMARNMARSNTEVAPASVMDDADIDRWAPHADVTVRLLRAIAAGAAASPALNAWFDGAALARTLHRNVDVGVAVETEDGLFVPVVRDVASRPASEIRSDLDLLQTAVADRTVTPEQLRGATVALSNYGTYAGRYAVMVLVPPLVAILGCGRARHDVVAREGQVVVRRLLPLSLTFDHRAATGAEAARFLAAAIADLELPE